MAHLRELGVFLVINPIEGRSGREPCPSSVVSCRDSPLRGIHGDQREETGGRREGGEHNQLLMVCRHCWR